MSKDWERINSVCDTGQLGEEAPQADDVVRDLRNAAARLRRTPMPLSDVIPLLQRAADRIESDAARIRRGEDGSARESDDIEQTLGRVLGYPRYCDDQKNFPGATDADGVCVGDHVPASLAAEAAARIESDAREIARLTTDSRYHADNADAAMKWYENAERKLAEVRSHSTYDESCADFMLLARRLKAIYQIAASHATPDSAPQQETQK